MRMLSTVLFVFTALVNLAPVIGVSSAERLQALYGVALADANLAILMRHRAALFAIVGALLLSAAFRPPLRSVAAAAGFASMLSFVVLVWSVGEFNSQIWRIAMVDLVASMALLAAVLIDAFLPAE